MLGRVVYGTVLAVIPGEGDVIADTLSFMTALHKEQLLAKLQEYDALIQAMLEVRSEIYNILGTIPDNEKPAEIGMVLTFYDNGHIISWGDDSEHFRPSTFRLLQQLYIAPDHTLSKEDVCADVIEDEYASDLAVRLVITKARKELENVEFPYAIETLQGMGYRLKWKETTVSDLRNGEKH